MNKIFIKHDNEGFYIKINNLCSDTYIAKYLNITLKQYLKYGIQYNGQQQFYGLSFNNYEDIKNFKDFIEILLVAKILEGENNL